MGTEPEKDEGTAGAPGFFGRIRISRLAIGIVMTVVLVAAYVFAIQSYRSGIPEALPEQSPPPGGVAVVIVPERMSPENQELPANLLLFPSDDLLDESGQLTVPLEIRIQPALSDQVITYSAGDVPSPVPVLLPASGVVQQYPFDHYAVGIVIGVTTGSVDEETTLPTAGSLFFRVPGWSVQDAADSAGAGQDPAVSAEIVRDGSTKAIAVLLLLLMVVLALIAVMVTSASTRGRMKLELSVASWMTAMLFALLPIRGFFPGAPPLGSWMDILVFFWVELVLMLSVAAVASTILLRANDAHRHPA